MQHKELSQQCEQLRSFAELHKSLTGLDPRVKRNKSKIAAQFETFEPESTASALKKSDPDVKLRAAFSIRNSLTPEYQRALALSFGCEEEYVREAFRRYQTRVREWIHRLPSKSHAPPPSRDPLGGGAGGGEAERAIVRRLVDRSHGGLSDAAVGDFLVLARQTQSLETIGRLVDLLLRTPKGSRALGAVTYNVAEGLMKPWSERLIRERAVRALFSIFQHLLGRFLLLYILRRSPFRLLCCHYSNAHPNLIIHSPVSRVSPFFHPKTISTAR